MSEKRSGGGGEIVLCGAVFIVFLVLKLTGNIDWSWWWVTAPLWGPLAIGAATCLAVAVFVGLPCLFLSFLNRRRVGR